MMPALTDLPVELLHIIILDTDTQDLRRLCLTSRKLSQIAQPILFRYYDEKLLKAEFASTYTMESDTIALNKLRTCLVQFTISTIKRPDLALCVRSIECAMDDWDIPVSTTRPSTNDGEIFIQCVNNMHISSELKLKWITGLQTYCRSDILALLVSQTLKLERLKVDIPDHAPQLLQLARTINLEIGVPLSLYPFYRLESLLLHNCVNFPLPELAPIFLLPSLTQLHIGECVTTSRQNGDNTLQLASDSSYIEDLSIFLISSSDLDKESLTTLLMACKRLEEFSYQVCYHDTHTFLDIMLSLKKHEEHLEVLNMVGQGNPIAEFPAPSPLARFIRLTRVRLSDEFSAHPVDWLPSSLVILSFYNPRRLPRFDYIKDAAQSHLTNLKWIRLELYEDCLFPLFRFDEVRFGHEEGHVEGLIAKIQSLRAPFRVLGIEIYFVLAASAIKHYGHLQLNSVCVDFLTLRNV
jgi:hypothetical protein